MVELCDNQNNTVTMIEIGIFMIMNTIVIVALCEIIENLINYQTYT